MLEEVLPNSLPHSFQELLLNPSKGAITLRAEIYPLDGESFERGGERIPRDGTSHSRNGPMTLRALAKRRSIHIMKWGSSA